MTEAMLRRRLCMLLLLAIALCAGCQLERELLPLLTTAPTATAAPEWERIADGLAWRRISPDDDEQAQLIVIRVEPSHFRFRALYRPSQPKSLSQWREQVPDAAVIINANFFDEAQRVIDAIISDSQLYGEVDLYTGGSFLARDGVATVRDNTRLGPLTGIEQLVQGWPMLVDGGNPAYVKWSDSDRARRTIIAEDTSGRILIIVAPWLGLSLPQLSDYLTKTDLNIVRAVNLDGGGSTMLAIPGINYRLPSLEAVPAVLAVYPR